MVADWALLGLADILLLGASSFSSSAAQFGLIPLRGCCRALDAQMQACFGKVTENSGACRGAAAYPIAAAPEVPSHLLSVDDSV